MPASHDAPSQRYVLKKPLGIRPALFLAGGAAALLVALLIFVLQLLTPPEKEPSFPLMIMATVIPSLFGIFALGYGFMLLRSVTAVELGPEGLALRGPLVARRVAWEQVARVETDKIEYPYLNVELDALVLYDARGRKLASLTSQLKRFPDLVKRVEAAVGTPAADARLRRSKAMAFFLGALALVFPAAAVFVVVDARTEAANRQLLAAEGVEVEAAVLRHHRFNVAHRLEYRFEDAQGNVYTRDATVEKKLWEALVGAPTVRVRYVPSNPDYSRLVQGEVEPGFQVGPPLAYLMAAGLGLMSVFFAVAAVLRWKGMDIDFDSKTGKIRIVRFGEKQGRGA